MPKLLLLPALLLWLPLSAQYNLVPNPSFEDYNSCPVSISGFDFYADAYVDDWYSAGGGTSDYFNACADGGTMVDVPDNLFTDFQPAHTGVGYGGFWVNLYDNNTFIYREYCQAELLAPLVAGECYYVEFWSAPATTSDIFGDIHGTSDAIGALLSTEKLGDPADYGVLPGDPQVDNNATGNYINPPGAWTKVSGFITAEGGEDWIVIGNFHSDDEVECVPYTGGPEDITPLVYLFVDDVLVTPVDSMTYLPDTISCNPVELIAPDGAISYLWNTGETTASITVSVTGTYWVEIELPCATITDTAFVQIVADSTYITNSDIEICFTELPYTLTGDPAYDGYLWNTGETTSSINIADGGIYVLTGYSDCAIFVDSFSVSVIPPATDLPDLGNDTLICIAEWSLPLSGPAGFASYLWSTGDTTQQVIITEAGIITLQVTSTCETLYDTITITEDPYLLATMDLGEDLILCPPAGITEYILDPATDIPTYTWSTGETTETISVDEAGTYFVTYESLCRTIADTIAITTCTEIAVPGAFSPNGDGTNDVFTVIAPDPSVIISFSIFNRWGELLFEGDAGNFSWSGEWNGVAQPIGTYVYVLRYTEDGISKILQGNFVLVR